MQRWLLVLTAALMLGGKATAQYSYEPLDPTPYGFAFRGGAVFPIDDDVRDVANTWYGIGVDFTFTKQFLKNSETFVSLDFMAKDTRGSRGTMWPLMINQRFYSKRKELEENRTYVHAGIGMVIMDIVDSDTVFGGRVGIGRELSRHIFVEANLVITESGTGGLNGSSAGVYVGYRF